jgi:hypothetical protein
MGRGCARRTSRAADRRHDQHSAHEALRDGDRAIRVGALRLLVKRTMKKNVTNRVRIRTAATT